MTLTSLLFTNKQFHLTISIIVFITCSKVAPQSLQAEEESQQEKQTSTELDNTQAEQKKNILDAILKAIEDDWQNTNEQQNKAPSTSFKQYLEPFTHKELLEFWNSQNILSQDTKDLNKDQLIKLIEKYVQPIIIHTLNEKDEPNNPGESRKTFQLPGFETKEGYSSIYFQAEEIFLSGKQKESNTQRRKIFLFGNVMVQVDNVKSYGDGFVVVLDKNNIPAEIFSIGKILLVISDNTKVFGKKGIFYPQINQGELLDAIGHHTPFFLSGKTFEYPMHMKFLARKGMLTGCNLLLPHYTFYYSKAWFHPEEAIWATNVTYQIGHTKVAYLPIFFRSEHISRLRTELNYEQGMGWTMHNTLVFIPGTTKQETRSQTENLKSSSMSIENITSDSQPIALLFALDFYQKMGVYLENQISYQINSFDMFVQLGLAYDRATKYDYKTESFSNILQTEAGNYDEINNLRHRITSNATWNIFTSNWFQSDLYTNFKTMSDPGFESQFQRNRKYDFELEKVLGLDQTEAARGGYKSYSENPNITVSWTNQLGSKLSIETQMELDYNLYLSPKKFRYITSNYITNKNFFTLPRVSINFSNQHNLIETKTDTLGNNQQQTMDELYIFPNSQTMKTIDSDSSPFQISLPLTYSIQASFSYLLDYDEQKNETNLQDSTLNYRQLQETTSASAQLPLKLSWKFANWSLSGQGSISQSLKKTTPPQHLKQKKSILQWEKIDKRDSNQKWNFSTHSSFSLNFFKEYQYLYLTLNQMTTYSHAGHFAEEVLDPELNLWLNNTNKSRLLSFSGAIEFAQTKLEISSSNQYHLPKQWKSKNPNSTFIPGVLNLTLHNNTFNFFELNNTFSYSRQEEKAQYNVLNLNFIIATHSSNHWFFLNHLKQSLTWRFNYQNKLDNNLTHSFAMQFFIGPYWNLEISLNSYNNALLQYTSEGEKHGYKKKNFFVDLLKSFNIFHREHLHQSSFKIRSLNFILKHDIHNWMIEFGVALSFKKTFDTKYFSQSFQFAVYLKEMPGFKYPELIPKQHRI